jgi:UDP-N-acetylglucosamine--N-acetylmuramyl-(pentapeptide) pyrophosphoryl-undecaprenol N-acetylglucosamine transferase
LRTLRILVTGGGSSGHISPALAIIQAIKELAAQPDTDWTPEFLYVGGRRGLEKDQVTAAGIKFVGIETGKLRRYLSLENLTDQFRLPIGLFQSLAIVRRFRPDAVLSTGGYVAVPPVVAAALRRVPVIIHEQTVQIGLANRITSRFATRIALSFPSALDELAPRLRAKAEVFGNPVRGVIFNGDRDEAVRICGFDPADNDLPAVYVTGGSQGARVINRAVEAALPNLLTFCRIVHQCGRQPAGDEQDYDRLQARVAALPAALQRRYYVTRFVAEEIKHVFALADVVVGRAGAGTVTEICTLGKPAIYVPLVPTGGDEQNRNARMCVDAGAATIIPQAEIDGERLVSDLRSLLADRQQLNNMGATALTLARPHAARELAEAVVSLAQR